MTLATTNPFDDDHMHEECAIFGIYGTSEANINTALGLHALQHRGQEAAGIVSFDGRQFHQEKHMGLVGDHYTDPAVLAKLPGVDLQGVSAEMSAVRAQLRWCAAANSLAPDVASSAGS